MSRCHVIYAIMRREHIQIGEMIARSIKRMISGPNSYIGHPFVITTLYRLREVPTEEDTGEISSPERPLGHSYFRRAVRDLEAAQAAAAAPQPPPPAPHQEVKDQRQLRLTSLVGVIGQG
ncbi:hypothetical protein A2U01_0053457, partial [Trifolium medium]|nr:hypothetical protein [Trifolium medium]